MKRPFVYVVLLVVLSLPLDAAARRRAGPARAGGRGTEMLSVWGVLDPGPASGVGLGGRLMLPLGPGVLHHPRVRDELTLEVGADLAHYSDRVGVYPYYVDYSWTGVLAVAGGTWNLWLTPEVAVYPKVDLGYWFGSYRGWDGHYGYGRPDHGGLFVQGALGLVYRLQSTALRVELGSGLLRIGLGFQY